MSARNVFDFLRTVAARADVIDSLKVQSKEGVIEAAASFGFPFSEPEFDQTVRNLEIRLAQRRQEPFDPQFSLWRTMWGKYYFEYLVNDLLPSLTEDDFAAVSGTSIG